MDWVSVIVGAIVSVIIALIGVGSTMLTSATQKRTAEIESSGPDWKSFTEEIRKQNEDTKRELNGKIDRLQDQVTTLRSDVRSIRGKFLKAMVHISAWRRYHPDSPLVSSLPDDLHADLPPESHYY